MGNPKLNVIRLFFLFILNPLQGIACPLESSDFRDISNQRNLPDIVVVFPMFG
jgi:hypothetical protein